MRCMICNPAPARPVNIFPMLVPFLPLYVPTADLVATHAPL